MRRSIFILYIAVCSSFLKIIPSFAASAGSVVINEVAWMGTAASTSDEWIEFYNTTDSPIDIGSWSIYGADTGKCLNFSDAEGSITTTIPADDYLIYANHADDVKNSEGANIVDVWDATIGMNNTSPGQLILYDAPDCGGNEIDTANQATGDWFAGDASNRITMERIDPSASGSDSSNWLTNDGITVNGLDADGSPLSGTPKAQNSVYQVSYPSGIYLWEYLPHPTDGNEWVEIYNENAEVVTLANWQLDDVEGGSSPKTFTATIAAKGYATVDLGSSFLNNDGDSVRLIRSDGEVVEETSFTTSYKGNSFAKDAGGSWRETKTPTPGAANVIESPVHNDTIAGLKKLTLGSRVEFEAYISVQPDILGGDDFYVNDSSSGIKVSCTCELEKDSFYLGDKVKVASTIEESRGEKYIKTEAVTVLQKNLSQVEPREIQTGQVGEDFEGRLVEIEGEVESSSGDTFYVDDGSGEAKVYVKDTTGIVRLKLKKGYRIRVLGIVSQYGFLDDGSSNHRLLPRYQGDVEILSFGSLSEEGSVLGAVTELPATGVRGDLTTIAWTLLFLGLSFRIKYHLA